MFQDIEVAKNQWVARRKELLRDAVLLATELDVECGQSLERFVDRIHSLDATNSEVLLTDPLFQRQMRILTDVALATYDHALDSTRTSVDVAALRAAVHDLIQVTTGNSVFSQLPLVGWIRIVTGSCTAHFECGQEYGVEIDAAIDLNAWESATANAIELIRLNASNYKLVRHFVSYIVPLKQRRLVQNLSFSSRELPNVVFKNKEASAVLFGETLVHEADHQFYYALEECYSLWIGDIRCQPAAYHSPWRDDSRPLDGIFRGLSAFARVIEYYLSVLPAVDPEQRDTVGSLCAQRIVECEDAAATLLRSGELSNAGAEYAAELSAVVAAANRAISVHQPSERWRTVATIRLNEHKETWRKSRLIDPAAVSRDHL